ncbi:Scr1 family TA system antitoxin-like transcriptional regulator [Streptomyces sp. HPF1205]|uniref:Scr1 family TA system antitoxin-like transcriptional regulator n=1 Tax=Streptomyces sp. HPF1205 TaxID=2873262 RepID=UPI0035ABA02E
MLQAGGVLDVLQDEVDRAKLPRFFRNFALIEAEVVSRLEYEPLLIPGLVQTEGYARAVFAGHCPPLDEDIVDQHTEARLSRQKLLARVPLAELSFVIAEEALQVESREHQHLGYLESQGVGCVVSGPADVSASVPSSCDRASCGRRP